MRECPSSDWVMELVTESVSDCDWSSSGSYVVVSGCWCISIDPICKCLVVCDSSASLSDSYLVLGKTSLFLLHLCLCLFLQLLAFTGNDCLLSWSLLGDLLCVLPLHSL